MADIESHVPHYNIYGHQHHRHPFKDKSYVLQQEVQHPRWLAEPPQIKSRSELFQARKRGAVPDASYDFDGDGVVGDLDYFVGRTFDKDADGRLTLSERGRAQSALDRGFMDKYVRGLEGTGPVHRGLDRRVRQSRGEILSADNNACQGYPPHHNSQKIPNHATQTALALARSAELKGCAAQVGERYAAAMQPIDEPMPPTAKTHPRACSIERISERAEADHQASRLRGGLLPMSMPVNPERELKVPGLEHVYEPVFATRGQLLETRKEAMKRECEDLRAKGDEIAVPLSVRRAEKEANEFEFRRPKEEPMTLTRMKAMRKQDRIEHDMSNFNLPKVAPREYPRYSDREDIPFWMTQEQLDRSLDPNGPVQRAIPRSMSEPALKITDAPAGHVDQRELQANPPTAAFDVAAAGKGSTQEAGAKLGSKTKKRWSADMIERGQGRNQPRIFDNIPQARIGPKDLQSLDCTSSMETIRNAALRRQKEEWKHNALNPRRSRLWTDTSQVQTSMQSQSQAKMSGDSADRTMGQFGSIQARPLIRSSQPQSDGNLRASAEKLSEKTREPKFFGTTAKPPTQTGVRCGGFQAFEWRPRDTRPPPPPAKSRIGQHSSKEGGATNTAAAAAAAQPL